MSTSDNPASRKQSNGKDRTSFARFAISKLTDNELNSLFLNDRERCDLAAALGCDPYTVFLIAVAEDWIRCLSKAAKATAVEAR